MVDRSPILPARTELTRYRMPDLVRSDRVMMLAAAFVLGRTGVGSPSKVADEPVVQAWAARRLIARGRARRDH